MPHVMPRARSSKSSGRVRQIKQRSAAEECGCGCWCSDGAVWIDGWAAFGAFPTAGARFFIAFVAAGELWMLALRESVAVVGRGVLVAIIWSDLHQCPRLNLVHLHSRREALPMRRRFSFKSTSPILALRIRQAPREALMQAEAAPL
jgi:hypothetical protein